MEDKKFIYLIFSSTPFKIGALIRKVTGEKYNHVSLSLNPGLNILYSFARRYSNTPFYGGFVKESAIRYRNSSRSSNIKVCAIPVTEAQQRKVAKFLFDMNTNSCMYLYNMISAIFTPIHKKVSIEKAYTCIEFIVDVLDKCGISEKIDSRRFYSLSDLQNIFENYIIYEGAFENAHCDLNTCKDTYIIRRNIAVRTYLTLSANAGLLYQMLKSKVKSK